MCNKQVSLQRGLGRVEARVADLTLQIQSMHNEVSEISRTVKSDVAAHSERLKALEASRRFVTGIISALFLSGVAAAFAYFLN